MLVSPSASFPGVAMPTTNVTATVRVLGAASGAVKV